MKHTYEEVKEMCAERGLILDTTAYINNRQLMTCHDLDGFYYIFRVQNFVAGKTPYKFSKFNPYTIQNIQLVLNKDTDGVTILSTEYQNNNTKLKFLCSCGAEFVATNNEIVAGKRYCEFCERSKRFDNNDYTPTIMDKCKEIGCTLLTKEKITRQNQKFNYICNNHPDEILTATYPVLMKSKTGCSICGAIQGGIKHRVDETVLKELAESKGFTLVDYDYVRRNEKASSKVRLHCLCNKHADRGVQYLDYYNLQHNKTGCWYCTGKGRTQQSYQKELDEANRQITILQFNTYQDLVVKCDRCGYTWGVSGISLTSGSGCPRCSFSRYERRVEDVLIRQNITYTPQYWLQDCRDINPLPFDFYLPEYNTMIEVDGQGHYYPVHFGGMSEEKAQERFERTKKHDEMKTLYCKTHNINLLRIPYFDLDNKNINLEQYILNRIMI